MRQRASLASIALGLLLAAPLFSTEPNGLNLQTARQTASAAQAHATVIPFELVNRHIVLKVKVNNSRALSFVFDTGNRVAIIDLDVAKELGLDLQGQVAVRGAGTQALSGHRVQNASFTIPGLEGFSQPVRLAFPLKNLAARLGQDFDGILGSEFIEQFVVEIDYAARLIKLHDRNSFVYNGPGESIPVQLNFAGHPIIEAEVTPVGSEPVKGKFVVDLGSGEALALYSPFVTSHHLLNPGLKTIRAIGRAGAGGAVTGQLGRVSLLTIGKFKIKNPFTFFSQDTAGATANAELIGNIGEQIVSRFKVLLDYGSKRIILEPNARFAEPFDHAISGLSLQAEGANYRTFRVLEVLENSPASEAGLQKNDVILAVDGKPATEFTLSKLSEMFERAASYKLTVLRGEQRLQVTLKPRRLV